MKVCVYNKEEGRMVAYDTSNGKESERVSYCYTAQGGKLVRTELPSRRHDAK
jgi:hypothetical protein